MIDFNEPLSREGFARREQILQVALGAARRKRIRRRAVRAGGGVTALAIVVLAVMHRPTPPVQEVVIISPATRTVEQVFQTRIERIGSDPTIVQRLSIGDDELLTSLAQAGEQAGIIHMQGEAVLVTQEMSEPQPQ